jgi:hypothetical protein
MKTYSQQGLYRAVDIFNHPKEYPSDTRILGFRFLTQWAHKERNYRMVPQRPKIISQMIEMVHEHSKHHTLLDNSVLMDIVDILNDYSPEHGHDLLAQLRECEAVANNNGPKENGPECTVYGDSQSVHNKTISESVRQAAKYLTSNYDAPNRDSRQKKCACKKSIPKYNEPGQTVAKCCSSCKTSTMIENQSNTEYQEIIREEWLNMYPKHKEILNPVFDRLFVDNAHFDIGYTVDQVFFRALGFIESLPKQDQQSANSRMCEELIEMQGYCSSGMLSHVVNAIQGFTDIKELQIRISDREQVKSVLYAHLNKAIQDCGDEEVVDGLTEGGDKFLNFVHTEIDKNIDMWYETYGEDFHKYLAEVANEYTSVRMYE